MRTFALGLLASFITLTMFSCSTISPVVCSVETAAAGTISASIATALSCTNTAQIQSDVLNAFGKANLCSVATSAAELKVNYSGTPLKGPVGDVICPIAVTAAVGLLSAQVPSSWGCLPSASTSGLATVLTTACEAAITN